MSTFFDITDADDEARDEAFSAAVASVRNGELVVVPTDTVYGVGCDAFSGEAVAKLLAAKGRGRAMPPPVMIGSMEALDALAAEVPPLGRLLVEKFWPGALTVIVTAQPSLTWDLGETYGTVAIRLPDHPDTQAVLKRTGPMAVSSANITGLPAATTAAQARDMLEDRVAVYLEAGPSDDAVPSTIVDLTQEPGRVVRRGKIELPDLRRVYPQLCDSDDDQASES